MNRIYVFSSTGNGLYGARRLAEGLDDVEILSIPWLMKRKKWTIEGDRVGFVFPCYYGESPQLLRRFIKEAERVNAGYFFGLVTAGGSQGRSLVDLDRALSLRGGELHYGMSYGLVSNYMPGWYYNLIWPSVKELKKRHARENEILSRGSRDIQVKRRRSVPMDYAGFIMPKVLSPSKYIEDTRTWDREFSVNSQCSGCGTCVKACPVDNLRLESGKPQFMGNCQRCAACLHYCPARAISVNGKPMNKKVYRHSCIEKKELFRFHQEGRM